MKSDKFQKRFYRDWVDSKDLIKTHFFDKETDIFISTDKPLDKEYLRKRISYYRKQIEDYIIKDEMFLTSFKPIRVKKDAAGIVKDMEKFSRRVGVGPMASVAGAIAQYLGKDLLKICKEVIIENGGDIFIKTRSKRQIGIYAGESPLSKKIFLEIEPKKSSFGICTSSKTVGHSLSFGKSDATVILADSSILADAAATAVGNLVNSPEDLDRAVDFAKLIKGIAGILIIIRSSLSVWGDLKISK